MLWRSMPVAGFRVFRVVGFEAAELLSRFERCFNRILAFPTASRRGRRRISCPIIVEEFIDR